MVRQKSARSETNVMRFLTVSPQTDCEPWPRTTALINFSSFFSLSFPIFWFFNILLIIFVPSAHSTCSGDGFGASAPGGVLMDLFGFTPAKVAEQTKAFFAARASLAAEMGAPAVFAPLPTHF